ncbi:MAG: N-6 DNA methylase [Leptospiraceae bacterium]|nr:N-6 DNA methylase [Leptospiraceae bacterium]
MKLEKESKLLFELIRSLGYNSGKLVNLESDSKAEWLDLGDWIEIAKGISELTHILFIKNQPILMIGKAQSQEEMIRIFNSSWCMMRPKFLFLISNAEITLFDLTQKPIKDTNELQDRIKKQVRSTNQILETFQEYSREKVESYDFTVTDPMGGAESQFIKDLNSIRNILLEKGLNNKGKVKKLKYSHSIIGRSIFIRYLEDRGILTKDYFLKVAGKKKEWIQSLEINENKPHISYNKKSYYSKVLRNKEFTFRLFSQLKEDFNGDMFSLSPSEEKYVKQEHLNLVSQFLLGDIKDEKLFFWAYNFQFIPIETISSIYEEFYHEENHKDTKGTNYTPSTLVEFLVSDTITQDVLKKKPRVLDPACGSGIFLVEAFKRIIRYNVIQKQKRLTFTELNTILKEQIFGIEINPEALKVTSFSLYLALLNHLEPKDILENVSQKRKLPPLLFSKEETPHEESFHTLVHSDAFLTSELEETIQQKFQKESFDVVLGNPPWGSKLDAKQKKIMQDWCYSHEFPIGDKEPSQAFIGLSISFLKKNGKAGLLISSGVFFKHGISFDFRNNLLQKTQLQKVVNFDHVRDVFFSGGRKKDSISPFASVIFINSPLEHSNIFEYWTAKKITQLNSTKAVILHKSDLKLVRQEDFVRNHKLWKVYWWGGHRDRNLIEYLESSFDRLEKFVDPENTVGQGYIIKGKKPKPRNWKKDYYNFPISNFKRYGQFKLSFLESSPPENLYRFGLETVFNGSRLILGRGIKQKQSANGTIIARLEENDFCFTNSIIGIKLLNPETNKYKIILATLWSSLGKYFLFLISTDWGRWHHEVFVNEYLRLPIHFPEDKNLEQRIIRIVDELRNTEEDGRPSDGLFENKISKLESELDKAIYELYNLDESEIELIEETCNLRLDLLYNHTKSIALKKLFWNGTLHYGLQKDLEIISNKNELQEYALRFLQIWNPKVASKGELLWQVLCPENSPMVGFIFYTHEKNKPLPKLDTNYKDWKEILSKLSDSSLQKLTKQIYIDGMIRIVSERYIVIIKRNEKRLWTKISASEDAEAVLVQAIHKQRKKS